jgi:hypothetical protein
MAIQMETPKEHKEVERLSENLQGVAFTGGEELGSAVDEVSQDPGFFQQVVLKIKKILGLGGSSHA